MLQSLIFLWTRRSSSENILIVFLKKFSIFVVKSSFFDELLKRIISKSLYLDSSLKNSYNCTKTACLKTSPLINPKIIFFFLFNSIFFFFLL